MLLQLVRVLYHFSTTRYHARILLAVNELSTSAPLNLVRDVSLTIGSTCDASLWGSCRIGQASLSNTGHSFVPSSLSREVGATGPRLPGKAG